MSTENQSILSWNTGLGTPTLDGVPTYVIDDGWSLQPPTNPEDPAQKLWVLEKTVADYRNNSVTPVDWELYDNIREATEFLTSRELVIYKIQDVDLEPPVIPVGVVGTYDWVSSTLDITDQNTLLPPEDGWTFSYPDIADPGKALYKFYTMVYEVQPEYWYNFDPETGAPLGPIAPQTPVNLADWSVTLLTSYGITNKFVTLNANTYVVAESSTGIMSPNYTGQPVVRLEQVGYSVAVDGNTTWASTPALTFYNDIAVTNSVDGTEKPSVVYVKLDDLKTAGTVSITATTTIDAAVYTDTTTIAKVKDGGTAITVSYTNPSHPLSTDATGAYVYTGSGGTISIFEGATQLTYDNSATYDTSTFRPLSSSVLTGTITAGACTGTDGGSVATIAAHSAMTSATATIKYTFRVTRANGTTEDVSTIATVYGLVKPLSLDLTNDLYSVSTDFDGTNNAALSNVAVGVAELYSGQTKLTSNVTFSIDSGTFSTPYYSRTINGVTLRLHSTTGAYDVSATAGAINADTITFPITATHNSVAISTAFVVKRLKNGEPNTQYWLQVSTSVISKASPDAATAGVYAPDTVTLTAKKTKGGVTTNAAGMYVGIGGTRTETTQTYTPAAGISSISAVMYDALTGGNLIDSETIPVVFKGATGTAAISSELTNDYEGIPTDSDGNNGVFTNASTTMKVYVGGVEETSGWAFTVSALSNVNYRDNDDLADRSTTGTISAFPLRIVSMSADTGYVELKATKGSSVLTNRFSVAKIKGGVNGTTVTVYQIQTSADVIYKDSPDVATDGTHSAITFKPRKLVGSATPVLATDAFYTAWPSTGSEAGTATAVTVDVTPTIDNNADITHYTFRLYNSAAKSVLLDEEIVRVVFKGAVGTPGLPGDDAASFDITTANAVFTKDKDGVIAPAGGITLATAAINFTGLTYVWKKNGGIISGATASSYTVPKTDFDSSTSNTYSCTATGTINGASGQVLSDSITIPRIDSNTENPVALLSNSDITFSAPLTGYAGMVFTAGSCTVTAYLGSTQLTYATSGANTFSCTNSSTGITVAVGSGSASTYTVPAPTAMAADSASTTVLVTMRNGAGVVVANAVPYVISYSVSRQGTPGAGGTDAVVISYTNGSHSVPVTNTNVETWTGSGGLLSVYKGGTTLSLASTTQSATYPATVGYHLDITKVSGDTLTEPSLSGTTAVTLDAWAGDLTQVTVYRITAYVRTDTSSTISISTDVTLTPSLQGADATLYDIYTSAPVITKASQDAATTGTYTSISVQGKRTVGSTTANYGYITVQSNLDASESTPRTDTNTNPYTLSPASDSGVSSYTIRLYAAASGGSALDTQVVPIVFKGTPGAQGDTYTLDITGGNRTLVWKATAFSPTTIGTFTATLKKNGTAITPTSYAWSANISGVSMTTGTAQAYAPTDSLTAYSTTTSSYVTCTVTYDSTKTISQTLPISIIGESKNIRGVVYYQVAQSSAPSTPTATSYTVSTNAFTTLAANWLLTPPSFTGSGAANLKYYAANYYVNTTKDVATSASGDLVFSAPTEVMNFTNLVRFTDLSTNGSTTISGDNITTGSISASRVNGTGLVVDLGTTGKVYGGLSTYASTNAVSGVFLGYDGTAYKLKVSNNKLAGATISTTASNTNLTCSSTTALIAGNWITFSSVGSNTTFKVGVPYYVSYHSNGTFNIRKSATVATNIVPNAAATGLVASLSMLSWDGNSLAVVSESMACGKLITPQVFTSETGSRIEIKDTNLPTIEWYNDSGTKVLDISVANAGTQAVMNVASAASTLAYGLVAPISIASSGYSIYGVKSENSTSSASGASALYGVYRGTIGGYGVQASTESLLSTSYGLYVTSNGGSTSEASAAYFKSIDAKGITLVVSNNSANSYGGLKVTHLGTGAAYPAALIEATAASNAGNTITATHSTGTGHTIHASTTGTGLALYAVNTNAAGVAARFKSGASTIASIELEQGGIKFPATFADSTDVNTLDDYEEGNWTPTVTTSTGSITTTKAGSYTKVGGVVHFTCNIAVTAVTTPGGQVFVSLPFTASSLGTASLLTAGVATNTGAWQAWWDNNATAITLDYFDTTTGTISGVSATKIKGAGNADIRISGSFITAS